MERPVISVRGIGKRYFIGKANPKGQKKHSLKNWMSVRGMAFHKPKVKEFWALKDIHFDLYRGERLGIIGRNGAGKTTLIKILSRLVSPTEGEARIRGRVTSLLGVGTGFNLKLTGRENIYLDATLHGLTRNEIDAKYDEIVEFSGVGKFIDTPVMHYSHGMHTRLAFSVAAHLDPDILMLDEVLSVGDMAFQQKCLKKVDGMTSTGRTLLFVSHNIGDIIKFCQKTIWLEEGRIIEYGSSKEVTAAYAKRMLQLQPAYHQARNPVVVQTPDPAKAPHPEACAAELISFEVKDVDENTKEVFFRNEPIWAHVKYRVLRDDVPLLVNVHLLKDGTHILTTHDSKIFAAPKLSVCLAKVEIPANLMNKGVFQFSIGIVTPTSPLIRHVKIENIASIQVIDVIDPNTIVCAAGDYRGVIRPRLPWHVSVLEEE